MARLRPIAGYAEGKSLVLFCKVIFDNFKKNWFNPNFNSQGPQKMLFLGSIEK